MQELVLEEHLQQCWKELEAAEAVRDEPDCVSNNGTPIWCAIDDDVMVQDMLFVVRCGNVHSSGAFYPMLKRSAQSNHDVKAAAK